MIIQCDSCQTKFKLNESAIKGAGVKVRCTKCQSVFVVTRPEVAPPSEPPPAPTAMEESEQGGLTDEELGLGVSAKEEPAPEESFEPPVEEGAGGVSEEESSGTPTYEIEDEGEADWGLDSGGEEAEAPAEESVEEEPAEAPEEEPEEEGEPDWGLDSGGGEAEAPAEESVEEPVETPAEPEEESAVDKAVDETDWGLEGGEEAEATDEAIDETDWGLGSEDESEEDEDTDDDEDWGLGEEDEVSGSVEDYTSKLETELGVEAEEGTKDEPVPAVETPAAAGEEDAATKVLSDNDFALGDRTPEDEEPAKKEPSPVAAEEEAQPEEASSEEETAAPPVVVPPEEAAAAMEKPEAKKGKLRVMLSILFIVAGVAILYFAGLFNNLMGPSGPPPVTLEIMDLRGAFVQNEDVGKLYTLQGRIKNISEESQEVVGVKVTIFDKKGKALTAKTVSLARLVTNEELKTLSGEELDRHYQDLSKGSIPPRGTTSLMAVFSNLPEGMDELEVEVVR